ncbi:histidine phosphatase family protein [Corynebacterium liangguodongii]|uniref:Histidine phosphatase family protein n=1 Tax=Corynebacterium liangguodongii TaxID=2079535 RepID=A0A2S0WGD9_9CORY|nr:histidine phosphatase family protein [Corynebacterium liangguodongii]AWB84858.1 histidine phosphatase family protein [Corynebacterium liangguodongii]PWB99215.1 histidine phosphatase family protein [Corynebacterium liangguodongii]
MLILLRHGQTTSNVGRYLDTALPGAELTDLGRSQAAAAGEEIMSAYRPARVVTSQALRARQTGRIAFGAHFADIPALPGLHEVQAGRFEMHNTLEAHAAYHGAFAGFYRRDLAALIDGGDSLAVFLNRYRSSLEPYVSEAGDTVAVSHGGAIRAFAANACDVDPEFAQAAYLPNCHYLVIDPVGEFGSWRVVKWGEHAL